MKFKVTYRVGQNIRDKNIMAKNLEDAVKVAEEKQIRWLDIIMINKPQKFGDNEDV